MNFFERQNNSLIFRENGETVMLTPWGENALRVRATYLGDIVPGENALLEAQTPEPEITLGDTRSEIVNGRLRAVCNVQPWGNALQISFYNEKGELLLREIPNGGALTLKPRLFRPLPGGAYRLKASFEADPEEKLYGMGQYQQERMDLKGCNLELAHRNSQASVPFYVSSLGYGFLWNNPAVGAVHFGLNTTEWEAESTKQLDYWITAGDTPATLLESYTAVTGHAPEMPDYGLGFWQCKLRYYNQQQVLDIARGYKQRGLFLDVLVIDFYHWPRCGDWRFDEEYFPDPKAMVDELHDMGIETMVSIWPQVDKRSENYPKLRQQGLLVRSSQGEDVQQEFHGNNVFLDVTNPRARKFAWDIIRKNYADLGIHTFWLDEAEPEFRDYTYDQFHYHAGPVVQVGNIYPREYARMFYEGMRANGQEKVVNLLRCAWAGSQRYGALVWSGDIQSTYEDFRKQICAGLHMGLAGIPWWTTDIGGFHNGDIRDPDFQELLVRWFEFGAFCPVMRLHGFRQPATPIFNQAGEERENTGADNEIWSYGAEHYAILKRYINLRRRMHDYIRDALRAASATGAPVMRTLFFEFPEDPKAWDVKDAYMFGPDYLVAPVCHKHAVTREVYLPEGARWTYWYTGETYDGGQTITVDAPIDVIPVFSRDGAEIFKKD